MSHQAADENMLLKLRMPTRPSPPRVHQPFGPETNQEIIAKGAAPLSIHAATASTANDDCCVNLQCLHAPVLRPSTVSADSSVVRPPAKILPTLRGDASISSPPVTTNAIGDTSENQTPALLASPSMNFRRPLYARNMPCSQPSITPPHPTVGPRLPEAHCRPRDTRGSDVRYSSDGDDAPCIANASVSLAEMTPPALTPPMTVIPTEGKIRQFPKSAMASSAGLSPYTPSTIRPSLASQAHIPRVVRSASDGRVSFPSESSPARPSHAFLTHGVSSSHVGDDSRTSPLLTEASLYGARGTVGQDRVNPALFDRWTFDAAPRSKDGDSTLPLSERGKRAESGDARGVPPPVPTASSNHFASSSSGEVGAAPRGTGEREQLPCAFIVTTPLPQSPHAPGERAEATKYSGSRDEAARQSKSKPMSVALSFPSAQTPYMPLMNPPPVMPESSNTGLSASPVVSERLDARPQIRVSAIPGMESSPGGDFSSPATPPSAANMNIPTLESFLQLADEALPVVEVHTAAGEKRSYDQSHSSAQRREEESDASHDPKLDFESKAATKDRSVNAIGSRIKSGRDGKVARCEFAENVVRHEMDEPTVARHDKTSLHHHNGRLVGQGEKNTCSPKQNPTPCSGSSDAVSSRATSPKGTPKRSLRGNVTHLAQEKVATNAAYGASCLQDAPKPSPRGSSAHVSLHKSGNSAGLLEDAPRSSPRGRAVKRDDYHTTASRVRRDIVPNACAVEDVLQYSVSSSAAEASRYDMAGSAVRRDYDAAASLPHPDSAQISSSVEAQAYSDRTVSDAPGSSQRLLNAQPFCSPLPSSASSFDKACVFLPTTKFPSGAPLSPVPKLDLTLVPPYRSACTQSNSANSLEKSKVPTFVQASSASGSDLPGNDTPRCAPINKITAVSRGSAGVGPPSAQGITAIPSDPLALSTMVTPTQLNNTIMPRMRTEGMDALDSAARKKVSSLRFLGPLESHPGLGAAWSGVPIDSLPSGFVVGQESISSTAFQTDAGSPSLIERRVLHGDLKETMMLAEPEYRELECGDAEGMDRDRRTKWLEQSLRDLEWELLDLKTNDDAMLALGNKLLPRTQVLEEENAAQTFFWKKCNQELDAVLGDDTGWTNPPREYDVSPLVSRFVCRVADTVRHHKDRASHAEKRVLALEAALRESNAVLSSVEPAGAGVLDAQLLRERARNVLMLCERKQEFGQADTTQCLLKEEKERLDFLRTHLTAVRNMLIEYQNLGLFTAADDIAPRIGQSEANAGSSSVGQENVLRLTLQKEQQPRLRVDASIAALQQVLCQVENRDEELTKELHASARQAGEWAGMQDSLEGEKKRWFGWKEEYAEATKGNAKHLKDIAELREQNKHLEASSMLEAQERSFLRLECGEALRAQVKARHHLAEQHKTVRRELEARSDEADRFRLSLHQGGGSQANVRHVLTSMIHEECDESIARWGAEVAEERSRCEARCEEKVASLKREFNCQQEMLTREMEEKHVAALRDARDQERKEVMRTNNVKYDQDLTVLRQELDEGQRVLKHELRKEHEEEVIAVQDYFDEESAALACKRKKQSDEQVEVLLVEFDRQQESLRRTLENERATEILKNQHAFDQERAELRHEIDELRELNEEVLGCAQAHFDLGEMEREDHAAALYRNSKLKRAALEKQIKTLYSKFDEEHTSLRMECGRERGALQRIIEEERNIRKTFEERYGQSLEKISKQARELADLSCQLQHERHVAESVAAEKNVAEDKRKHGKENLRLELAEQQKALGDAENRELLEEKECEKLRIEAGKVTLSHLEAESTLRAELHQAKHIAMAQEENHNEKRTLLESKVAWLTEERNEWAVGKRDYQLCKTELADATQLVRSERARADDAEGLLRKMQVVTEEHHASLAYAEDRLRESVVRATGLEAEVARFRNVERRLRDKEALEQLKQNTRDNTTQTKGQETEWARSSELGQGIHDKCARLGDLQIEPALLSNGNRRLRDDAALTGAAELRVFGHTACIKCTQGKNDKLIDAQRRILADVGHLEESLRDAEGRLQQETERSKVLEAQVASLGGVQRHLQSETERSKVLEARVASLEGAERHLREEALRSVPIEELEARSASLANAEKWMVAEAKRAEELEAQVVGLQYSERHLREKAERAEEMAAQVARLEDAERRLREELLELDGLRKAVGKTECLKAEIAALQHTEKDLCADAARAKELEARVASFGDVERRLHEETTRAEDAELRLRAEAVHAEDLATMSVTLADAERRILSEAARAEDAATEAASLYESVNILREEKWKADEMEAAERRLREDVARAKYLEAKRAEDLESQVAKLQCGERRLREEAMQAKALASEVADFEDVKRVLREETARAVHAELRLHKENARADALEAKVASLGDSKQQMLAQTGRVRELEAQVARLEGAEKQIALEAARIKELESQVAGLKDTERQMLGEAGKTKELQFQLTLLEDVEERRREEIERAQNAERQLHDVSSRAEALVRKMAHLEDVEQRLHDTEVASAAAAEAKDAHAASVEKQLHSMAIRAHEMEGDVANLKKVEQQLRKEIARGDEEAAHAAKLERTVSQLRDDEEALQAKVEGLEASKNWLETTEQRLRDQAVRAESETRDHAIRNTVLEQRLADAMMEAQMLKSALASLRSQQHRTGFLDLDAGTSNALSSDDMARAPNVIRFAPGAASPELSLPDHGSVRSRLDSIEIMLKGQHRQLAAVENKYKPALENAEATIERERRDHEKSKEALNAYYRRSLAHSERSLLSEIQGVLDRTDAHSSHTAPNVTFPFHTKLPDLSHSSQGSRAPLNTKYDAPIPSTAPRIPKEGPREPEVVHLRPVEPSPRRPTVNELEGLEIEDKPQFTQALLRLQHKGFEFATVSPRSATESPGRQRTSSFGFSPREGKTHTMVKLVAGASCHSLKGNDDGDG